MSDGGFFSAKLLLSPMTITGLRWGKHHSALSTAGYHCYGKNRSGAIVIYVLTLTVWFLDSSINITRNMLEMSPSPTSVLNKILWHGARQAVLKNFSNAVKLEDPWAGMTFHHSAVKIYPEGAEGWGCVKDTPSHSRASGLLWIGIWVGHHRAYYHGWDNFSYCKQEARVRLYLHPPLHRNPALAYLKLWESEEKTGTHTASFDRMFWALW